MPGKVLLPNYVISVGGKNLTDDVLNDVMEILVDSALYLPTACTLTVNNSKLGGMGFSYADSTTFTIGAKLKITMNTQNLYGSGQAQKAVIFDGEITGLEVEYNVNNTSLIRVRAYDQAYRLSQGKKTATFIKMTDADIIKKVVSNCGLTATVDTTNVTHEYVIQANQSDWDFILTRAQRNGLLILCEGSKLILKKPEIKSSGPELEWPRDLFQFEPRLSLTGQYTTSSGMGWDAKTKKEVKGEASSASSTHAQIGYGKTGSATIQKVIGKTEEVLTHYPVSSIDDAKQMAQSRRVEAEGQLVRAEGTALGNPTLKAGACVSIKGVGKTFSGTYLLSQVRHEIKKGEYQTWFSVNGNHPETVLGLLNRDDELANRRIDGVVTALVTNIKDPENGGKIKVKFPWMPKANSAEVESAWARVAMPNAGKNRGITFYPEVDDEVLVAFEHGDVNYPVIVGGLWNGKDTPPAEADLSSGKNNTRVIRSRSGHLIILDDTDGSEKITVKDKTGNNSIVIDTKMKTITFSADEDLVLTAKGKIKISGDKGITLDSKQDVGVTSPTKVTLTAASTNSLELATAGATVKGMKVDVQANTAASLKGNAMVEIQGGLVKIN